MCAYPVAPTSKLIFTIFITELDPFPKSVAKSKESGDSCFVIIYFSTKRRRLYTLLVVGLALGLNMRRPKEIMVESLQNTGRSGALSEST